MKGWFGMHSHRLVATFLISVFAPPLSVATPVEQMPLAAYEHAQTLVRLPDGRRINLLCTGQGSPTVVLEAGGGDDSLTYRTLQADVAHFSSAEYVLQDLHELLRQAGIPLPSMDGINALPDALAEACQYGDEPARARLQPQTRDANLGDCPIDACDARLRALCTRNTSTQGAIEPFVVDQLLRISGVISSR